MTRQQAGTYRANTLAKGDRECVEDIYCGVKPPGESLIAALRLIEFVGFPLKYGEDSSRRMAVFNLLCEWVGGKFFSGLLLVLFQGLIEDGLKNWSGGGCLEVGAHCDSQLVKSAGRKCETRTTFLRLRTCALPLCPASCM